MTKFETTAQRDCYERIRPWLAELFADVETPAGDVPVFVLPSGSATAVVEVLPWGSSESVIATWSYVVTGAQITADLMHFLLHKNDELPFGVFSVDDQGDIRFHATLIGSTCDRRELQLSVSTVLQTADTYDDQIVEIWGGQRAIDRVF